MNFKNLLGVAIFLCLIILGIIYNDNNLRKFKFSYSVIFHQTENKKFEAWIPYPQSNEVQLLSNITINTKLNYEILDETKHGNKYIYLYDLKGLSQDIKFELSCTVSRREHSNLNYSEVDPDKYLYQSKEVPVGDVFSNIIIENNLTPNNMRHVYDYVREGMHYGKPISRDNEYFNEPWLSQEGVYGMKQVSRDDVLTYYEKAQISGSTYTFGNGSSLYACDIGVGNCTDYHSYFMSLSRTMNIPARFHMGFSISNDIEGEIEGYHCWADYYISGEGWYPVDISEADKDSLKSDYFFGTICQNRVEFMVGRDFNLKNYSGDKVNILIYPLVEIEDNKSENFTKSFYYKNL